jgi:acyl-CoA reductase-like NAD-dependent aldehyde dehydrogenase
MNMNSGAQAGLRHYPHLYIGGDWVEPIDGGHLDSIDPATGKAWTRVAYGGRKDIDRAVAA